MPLIHGCSDLIKAALLSVATDLPAIRKVTQFLGHKADLGCHRCKFRAEREPGTRGASGKMSYYTSGISRSDHRQDAEVRRQATEFKAATTKSAAAQIAQRNGVRYSELVRLPYYDMVKMTTVDPMHTFLLVMIQRETELNLAMLSAVEKHEFLRRIKSLKLPYDIGRLPTNIFDGEAGLGSITAQQWKNYAIIFAKPCMFKLLPRNAYKSLVILSNIVSLVSSPLFTLDDIDLLNRHLLDHHRLFRQVYGKWEVTVTYHMALHIPEIILDFGPPQTFWCFSYERINGMLTRTPNSNRNISVEVMERFLRDHAFSSIKVPDMDIPSSLMDLISDDDFAEIPSSIHLSRVMTFLNSSTPETRFQCQQEVDRGDVGPWPLEFLHPSRKNIKITPSFLSELKSFFIGLYGNDFDYVLPKICKYGRCKVNGQTLSSNFNSTDRGSIVKTVFVDINNELLPYFGIARYYFTATALIQQRPKLHHLAYVTWMKFNSPNPEPLSQLYTVTKDLYVGDRIISPRRFLRRCVLVSPKSPGSETFFFACELPR